MTHQLVLFFDIDATLMHSQGAGMEALETACAETLGNAGLTVGVQPDGKIDTLIVREIFALHGLPYQAATERTILTRYVRHLEKLLRDAPERITLPLGTREFLDFASGHPEIYMGVLTGNIQAGAKTKLTAAGLWQYFEGGGFSDGASSRPEVAAIAWANYCAEFGTADFRKVYVIGDTPADIHCGKTIGARTIGLAAGRYSVDELRKAGAAVVWPDFSPAISYFSTLIEEVV